MIMNIRKRFHAGLLLAFVLSAQTPQPKQQTNQAPTFMGACSNLVCDVENDWSRNNAMLYGLANEMPADKYGFKPTPAQESFGQRVLHAAQINLLLLQNLGAKTPAPMIDMNATSKAASMDALQRVGDYGVAVIKELGEPGLLARIPSPGPTGFFMGPQVSRLRIVEFLMAHSQDTYGQLVVYLRLNGITPPLSRQP